MLVAWLLAGGGAGAQVIFKALAPATRDISPETVQALEKQVVMPADAAPLTSYDRYYAPGLLDKREVIVGVFLKRPSRVREGAAAVPGFLSAFTTTVEKLPRIKGGSCTVVTVYFDPAQARFLALPVKGKDPQPAVCNPLA